MMGSSAVTAAASYQRIFVCRGFPANGSQSQRLQLWDAMLRL